MYSFKYHVGHLNDFITYAINKNIIIPPHLQMLFALCT